MVPKRKQSALSFTEVAPEEYAAQQQAAFAALNAAVHDWFIHAR